MANIDKEAKEVEEEHPLKQGLKLWSHRNLASWVTS